MTTPAAQARERFIELPDLQLAARVWGPEDGAPVLALHGWLDNAASFDRLAPLLGELALVAIDLPGHGRSDHRPRGCTSHFIDWVADVVAAADALGWDRFSLLGHSMGAGIASLVGGVLGSRLDALALIEGLGPFADPPQEAPRRLAKTLVEEQRLRRLPVRVLPDLESAIRARMAGSTLDREAARMLVERATESTPSGVVFRHDQRLKSPSRLRMTEDQVLAFLAAITCPVQIITASRGFPFPAEVLSGRLAAVEDLEHVEVDGDHHVHLTDPQAVAHHLRRFLVRAASG